VDARRSEITHRKLLSFINGSPLGIGSKRLIFNKIEAKPEPLKKMLEKNLQSTGAAGETPPLLGAVTFLSRQSKSLTESLASRMFVWSLV
jgi:hypothetical protein